MNNSFSFCDRGIWEITLKRRLLSIRSTDIISQALQIDAQFELQAVANESRGPISTNHSESPKSFVSFQASKKEISTAEQPASNVSEHNQMSFSVSFCVKTEPKSGEGHKN